MTTTFAVEGFRVVAYKGLVRGLIVRAPIIGQSILKSLIDGQIGALTATCEQARQKAYDQMVTHAAAMGANAVIGVSYDTSEVREGMTEVLCFGTAVVIAPLD